MTNIKPSSGYVLIKLISKDKEEKLDSGIIIQNKTPKKNEAEVVAVGNDLKEEGLTLKAPCKINDTVIFDAIGASECFGRVDRLFLVRFNKILATVKL